MRPSLARFVAPGHRGGAGSWRSRLALASGTALVACAVIPAAPPVPAGPVALRIELPGANSVTLGSLRGKVVLVHIISSWAVPAVLEVPQLKALAAAHPPQDLVIVCVALDGREDTAGIFARTFEIPYPVGTVADQKRFVGKRGSLGPVRVVPTTVLLDRRGLIAARVEGIWDPAARREAVVRLLAADPGND